MGFNSGFKGLIYTKKELGYKLKHGIKNIGIEDYKDIVIVHDSK
jgi:hypothetical protein